MRHFRKHASSYAPAVFPFLLLFLGILLGLLFQDQKIVVVFATHAIYGFGPFLLLSYVLFHLIARPTAVLVDSWFPLRSGTVLGLLIGTIYGTVIGICIILFFQNKVALYTILFLLFGIVTGNLNWFFYRKLVGKSHNHGVHPIADKSGSG